MLNKVVIIGTGFMGCCFGLALKQQGLCKTIIGYDTSLAHLLKAHALQAIDDYSLDLSKAVQGADLICLAIPSHHLSSIFNILKNSLAAHTLITDLTSVKSAVMEIAESSLGDFFINFVPGHPIAGTEKSGPDTSHAELFKDKLTILTPHEKTKPEAVEKIKIVWQSIGAKVEILSPTLHDKMLGLTSHLPHVIAFAFMHNFNKNPEAKQLLEFAGTGFRDFTRIAYANPSIWSGICLDNRDVILSELKNFQESLAELEKAIHESNTELLKHYIDIT